MLSLIMSLLSNGIAYARDDEVYNELKNTTVSSTLLPEDVKVSSGSIESNARSTALATAMSEITNEGNGVISVCAETTMHRPVDWAYLTIYLERWYEDLETWQIEKTFEKEFLPEDEDDGELTTATLGAYIYDQPTGYYYRVRALHELEFDGDWYEAKVTKTDGILITSAP